MQKGMVHFDSSNDSIIESKETPETLSPREVLAREAAHLIEQQKRLSVRDLAMKFETGLHPAAKFSEEVKWKESAALDRHVLLGKLRDLLESLRGRVAGRNKDDVDEAVSMVEALAVKLTRREEVILREKVEMNSLGRLLKQASEDAERVVENERALARAEVQHAKATVERIEMALKEQEYIPRGAEQKGTEELMKEIVEARRIKMLHQPSRVRDMENELHSLRSLFEEKSLQCIQLSKELEMNRRIQEKEANLYRLEGFESLGSCLHIAPQIGTRNISDCTIQWYRLMPEGGKRELISGATKQDYAPEPFDVGHILLADITLDNGEKFAVATTGPINPGVGLGSYVDALVKKKEIKFNVVVLQTNGNDCPSQSIHVLRVGKSRIKLQKGRTTTARSTYSSSMQICGLRGGGDIVTKSLFWKAKKDLSFILVFESEVERNTAIMLARRFAADCNILMLEVLLEHENLNLVY